MIPIFDPRVSPRALERLTATLRAGRLSEGPVVREFEEKFCSAFGLPRALALNSGTAALHLAILGAGVKPGDEVITTAQTFVATAMAILYAGAVPVFADLLPGSPNIDPADAARRVTPRTRALLVVHYGGLPCEMDAIRGIAEARQLAVIEDAAHALGATWKGAPAGALGDFAAFSFQAIKQLTTGDGGMLVCRRPEDHQLAYRRRWFGIDRANRRPSELGAPEWDITEVGYKYHMNDLAAALGIGHLEDLPAGTERRRALNRRYRSELTDVPGLRLVVEPSHSESACWLFTVLVERRVDFVRALRSRGVEASVWHRRIDRHPLLGGPREDLPRQSEFDEAQVSIPLRETLAEKEVEQVLSATRKGW